MEEVQQRIQDLESGLTPPLLPLYERQRPKDLQRLTVEAYHMALDDFPEPNERFDLLDYSASLDPDAEAKEPKTFNQAMKDTHSTHWKEATDDEMASLDKNGTWDVVDRRTGMNVLSGKWVFKIKRGPNGKITRYKARWNNNTASTSPKPSPQWYDRRHTGCYSH